MIITGDLDSSVHFEEDYQLIKALKQFWETETIGILDDADVSQTTISELFLPSINLLMIVIKLNFRGKKAMSAFLLISVCARTG